MRLLIMWLRPFENNYHLCYEHKKREKQTSSQNCQSYECLIKWMLENWLTITSMCAPFKWPQGFLRQNRCEINFIECEHGLKKGNRYQKTSVYVCLNVLRTQQNTRTGSQQCSFSCFLNSTRCLKNKLIVLTTGSFSKDYFSQGAVK